jgi:hypothetical protein
MPSLPIFAKVCVGSALVTGAAGAQWQPHDVELGKLREAVVSAQTFQVKVSEQCEGAGNVEDCSGRVSDKLFCQLLKRSKLSSHEEVKLHCPDGTAANTPTISIPPPKPATVAVSKNTTAVAAHVAQNSTVATAPVAKNSTSAAAPSIKNSTAATAPVAKNSTAVETTKVAAKPKQFLQADSRVHIQKAPEDELAKEMTHDLEMNFNKIAPFGKEDTAKELQDHAAKTQDTLVDAVENAEVAEIKRAVFRALTRLRAATIKEFDTIARLETQAIDAYNDAHHYRAENPLAHLHEDEAPVETDKLKSFH